MPKTAPKLRFAHLAPEVWKALGKLPRTGWVNRGVENPETVQEHTVSLRNIAYSLENLLSSEREYLLNMLEVHDWAEAIHGDQVILTFSEEEKKLLKAEKYEKEKEIMLMICNGLGLIGKEIIGLWLCFENSRDKIAALARQLDKYQAIEKALEYEKTQNIPLFKEFLDYSRKDLVHPIITKKLDELETDWMLFCKR